MSGLSSSIWERRGASEISRSAYALLICLFTILGMAVTAVVAYFTQSIIFPWYYYLIVFAVTIGGCVVTTKSTNPLISGFGYFLVAALFGSILGPVIAQYTEASIVSVLLVTMVMTAVLGTIGAVIKTDLGFLWPYLFGGLTLLLVGYFIVPIGAFLGLPIEGALTLLDWAGVALFGFYVITDWNRAMRIPYTVDNSIDSALAIYLDIINIFIRLLARTGKKK